MSEEMNKCDVCNEVLPEVEIFKKGKIEKVEAAGLVIDFTVFNKNINRRHKKPVYRICYDCWLDSLGIKDQEGYAQNKEDSRTRGEK